MLSLLDAVAYASLCIVFYFFPKAFGCRKYQHNEIMATILLLGGHQTKFCSRPSHFQHGKLSRISLRDSTSLMTWNMASKHTRISALFPGEDSTSLKLPAVSHEQKAGVWPGGDQRHWIFPAHSTRKLRWYFLPYRHRAGRACAPWRPEMRLLQKKRHLLVSENLCHYLNWISLTMKWLLLSN